MSLVERVLNLHTCKQYSLICHYRLNPFMRKYSCLLANSKEPQFACLIRHYQKAKTGWLQFQIPLNHHWCVIIVATHASNTLMQLDPYRHTDNKAKQYIRGSSECKQRITRSTALPIGLILCWWINWEYLNFQQRSEFKAKYVFLSDVWLLKKAKQD